MFSYILKIYVKRKSWKESFDKWNEKQLQKQEGEKRLTILSTAMRLREKREDSKLRQENWKKVVDVMQQRYREYLEKQQIKRDSLNKSRVLRYNKLKSDLNEDKTKWISKSTVSTKINNDLFNKPCSTGTHDFENKDFFHCPLFSKFLTNFRNYDKF
jgi:arginyl-tRNA synthetase